MYDFLNGKKVHLVVEVSKSDGPRSVVGIAQYQDGILTVTQKQDGFIHQLSVTEENIIGLELCVKAYVRI